MDNSKKVAIILISIIIVLVILISLQQGSLPTNTIPGSHPQYYCCYSHPSQPGEEPPVDHPVSRP